MPKIILGKRPATFVKTVSIPLLDGTAADATFTFRTRTRTEYAALIDAHNATVRGIGDTAAAGDAQEDGGGFKLERFVGLNIEADADLIMKIAEGWDLDDVFSREKVVQFLNEYGGAGPAVTAACRAALNEGRLGN
jgi:hypothetical protein